MRTCRATPPPLSETEQSPETTGEGILNTTPTGPTIGQITPSGTSVPATPSSGYDRSAPQSANPDRMFERPLSIPSDPSQGSRYYHNTPPPPMSASTGWIGPESHIEDQHSYTHHAYTTSPGPLPQTYVPCVPYPISSTYAAPSVGHGGLSYHDPVSYAFSGITPLQYAETFQNVPYQSMGSSQVSYGAQLQQQYYSGDGHQPLSQQQHTTQQNVAPEGGRQGPSDDVH